MEKCRPKLSYPVLPQGVLAIVELARTIVSPANVSEAVILDESSLARTRGPFHSRQHSLQQRHAQLRTFHGGSSPVGIPKESVSSWSGVHRLAPIFAGRVRDSAGSSRRRRLQRRTPRSHLSA